MDNGQLFDWIVTILRKEKEGSAVSPERFTLMLVESMWEKINVEIGVFERSQVITNSLRSLKVSEDIAVTPSGTFDLTTLVDDYLHPTSLYYTYSGRVRQVDILTDGEWAYYTSSSLMAPTDEFPVAKILGDTIMFDPIASDTATLTFIKKPTDPFFDYYYDSADRIVYLQPGQSYALTAGEEYRDGTVFPATVNSTSVELPFPENERVDVGYKILQKMGIPLQEPIAVQYGTQREAKEESL